MAIHSDLDFILDIKVFNRVLCYEMGLLKYYEKVNRPTQAREKNRKLVFVEYFLCIKMQYH